MLSPTHDGSLLRISVSEIHLGLRAVQTVADVLIDAT